MAGQQRCLQRMVESRWLRHKPLVDPADRWQASLSKVRGVSAPCSIVAWCLSKRQGAKMAIFFAPCAAVPRQRHKEDLKW